MICFRTLGPGGGGRGCNAQAYWKGQARSNENRRVGSAADVRTTRHTGFRLNQVIRKRIDESFGWAKTVGRIRQTVFRGLRRVDQQFKLTMAANNLLRIARMAIGVSCGARA